MKNNTLIQKISSLCLIFVLSTVTAWAECLPPTGITVSNITQVSAKVDWTVSSPVPANGYEFQLRTGGLVGTTGIGSGYVAGGTTTNSFITFNTLNAGTTYAVYVRSLCANEEIDWSPAVTFTTTALGSPVAIPATNEDFSSFVARWEPLPGATEYRLFVSLVSESFDEANPIEVGSSLSKLVSFLLPNTPYKYKVQARAGSAGAWSGDSNIIAAHTTVGEGPVAEWTSEGWLQQPTPNKELIFRVPFNTAIHEFGTTLIGRKVTIRSGATLTIAPNTFIEVEENVDNLSGSPANFIIESNGHFNQIGTDANFGGATVKRNSFPIYRLDYTMWSSPVSGQQLQAFSPATLADRFYTYDSANDVYVVVPSSQNFEAGNGYLIRSPNTWVHYDEGVNGARYEGVFTGELNAGPVEVNLLEGFNLVGNPFPTDITTAAIFAANSSINNRIYFWRRRNNVAGTGPSTSFYATYTLLGGIGTQLGINFTEDQENEIPDTRPSDIIKVGQGFLVSSKGDGGVLTFNSSMKIADDNTDVFLKTNGSTTLVQAEIHKFYLNFNGGGNIASEILLGFASDALNDEDKYDAKYIGDSPIALTSIIDNNSYVIQAKALPFVDTADFALRFETTVAQNYTISLGDVTGMFTADVDPILLDMLTNTETNLRNASYTFASEAGTFDARFKIVFVENYLSNNDVAANANAVFVISKDNVLSVNAGTYTINNIDIFDIQGRKIYSKENVDASSTSISDLRAKNQIILVQIATDHGVVTKKVQF